MSKILLFGAGKSATVLIDYLVVQCARLNHFLEVVDAGPQVAKQKVADACTRAGISAERVTSLQYSIDSEPDRQASIQSADGVISLLPPHLHSIVAKDCLRFQRPLFTASYLDDQVKSMRADIEKNGLLFLYEMGLDPGIDHMSLMTLLDELYARGAVPVGIRSHCGGLVSPESDNNPWHYKISWNPRNVLMAGSAGAQFLLDGKFENRTHAQLFHALNLVNVPGAGELAFYPNRDSNSYLDLYGLKNMHTFQRTTLRHPDFIRGWDALIELGMIDEERQIELTPNTHLADALHACQSLPSNLSSDIRSMLEWLGWADHHTIVPFLKTTPAQLLQFCMEQKWVLHPADKDRIVMLHEIQYRQGNGLHSVNSWLILDGEDSTRTAMAKTVGLPLGIAAIQYLEGAIQVKGLQIPTAPKIYRPVLQELKDFGIDFTESWI